MNLKIKKSGKRSSIIAGICLAAAIVAIYWPVYKYEFIGFDDNTYVAQNVHIRTGMISSVPWAFTTNHAGNWHPLTWLSLAFDYQLFKNLPGGFHLVNVLYHILNSILLFYLFKYMTKSLWPGFFIAAAFAIHPLHIESVAWVAERKDVLSTFFWFLTMIAYVYYAKNLKIKWYVTALVLFILGLMSKPMLVTLPFVLLLIDYWPLERKFTYRLFVEKIPFFILSIISCLITFIVQRNFGSMHSGQEFGFLAKIYNAFVSYTTYITKMIWPANLAVLYPHLGNELTIYKAAVGALVILAISICFIYVLRKDKIFTMGWLWFIGTLIPVIGLVQVGPQAYADRYTYIPLIGLFIIIAFGMGKFLSKRSCILISISILVGWSFVSLRQIRYWKNDETLFTNTLRITKNNHIILGNYINYLIGQKRLDEAITKSKELLGIKPDSYQAHCNLSAILLQTGKIDDAEKHCKLALKYKPNLAQAYLNLAMAARIKGNPDKSVKYYYEAIKVKPDYMDAYICLAITYNDFKKSAEAIKTCNDGLRIEPDNPVLKRQLNLALSRYESK